MDKDDFIALVRAAMQFKTEVAQDHHLWMLHRRMQEYGERAVFEKIGSAFVQAFVREPPSLGDQLIKALGEDESPSPHG